jgi:hypothetical protein
MSQAIAALKRRVPLGATDMPVILRAAADSFRVRIAFSHNRLRHGHISLRHRPDRR